MEGKFLFEGNQNEVEKCDQGEYDNEHGVVDDGCIASESRGDHIADQTHYDNGEDKLCDTQAELQHVGHLD